MTECYCEIDFLRSFVNNIPEADPYGENRDFDIWRNFKKLIFEYSRLSIDNGNKLDAWVNEERDNKLAMILYKMKLSAKIEEKQFSDIQFETVNPHTVFFLTDAQKCKEMEEDYGMLFICDETKIDKAKIIFEKKEVSVNKNGVYRNYDFLRKYRHPCNCLIINDMYLLGETAEVIKENLFSLLDNILPDKLYKQKFQILILSGDGRKNIATGDCYRLSIDIIGRLNRLYDIELKIITKKADHNRNIITNYLALNAGHKFALFKNRRVVNNDQLKFSSIMGNDDTQIAICDLKKEYRKIERNTFNIGSQTVVMPLDKCGIITNRLLAQ